MAVEPLPAAQSADRPFSCLDQMKRIKAAPHADGRASILPKVDASSPEDLRTDRIAARIPTFHLTINSIRTLFRWLTLACALSTVLALSGCEPPAPRKVPNMAVGITGYTFTSEGVQEYYVNGVRGSNLPPYGGGGATSCCVSLPGQWAPGLTVKVEWITGHWTAPMDKIQAMNISEAIRCCLARRTLSKTVPVERYGKEGGGVQVFFLPNDEIKVWVTDLGLGHVRHPSGVPYPKNPADIQ